MHTLPRLKRTILVTAALLLALVVAPAPQAAHAGIAVLCYVDAGAGGTNDGSSWTNAYVSLQSALANPLCGEVWVKAGVYVPGASQSATFNVPPGKAVYGGFAGTETLRTQRSLFPNLTILSGDIDNNDANHLTTNIDATPADISGSNSFNVVTFNGTGLLPVSSTTVLDGFTITGGDGPSGAGLICYGGGATHACDPTLSNLLISGNRASGDGGGMFNDGEISGDASPILTYVTFSGNSAQHGGGMVDSGLGGNSSPMLTNVTFYFNTAAVAGGGMVDEAPSSSTSNPALTNVAFIYNHANDFGGGMFNDASGGASNPNLTNVTFDGNSAGSTGGAMFDLVSSGGSSLSTLVNVILWGDTAITADPEISNSSAASIISYSVVQGGCASITGAACGAGNRSTDPKFGSPGQNGHYIITVPLLGGSSAINAGNDGACPALDERAVTRPQGPHCDIGAFEAFPFRARADFDFNGTTDIAVFRPSTGVWYVKNVFNIAWGAAGDVPVPADFNNNGQSDLAVWRPSTGIWYDKFVFNSAWGMIGDVPVPGDYNGDGAADVAVWRPSDGKWYVKGQSTTLWGASGDIPVPGDYNGDGTTDLAVFRPSTGVWYIKGVGNFTWGTSTDIPVPADYDGNGTTDIAIYRPSTGIWYVRGLFNSAWGTATDIPVPGDYDGNGAADVAIFRPSTGQWFVKNQFTTTWGASGDFPVMVPDTNGDGTPYQ